MDAKLTFRYDRAGDVLYVETCLLRGDRFEVPISANLFPAREAS